MPQSSSTTQRDLNQRSPPAKDNINHQSRPLPRNQSTKATTMTSHPNNMYNWSTEIPSLLTEEVQDFESQSALQPFWNWAYEPTGYEPQSEESTASSPDSSYQQGSLEIPFYNPEDYLDLQRIGTPSSCFDEPQENGAQVSIDTTGTGANKRLRRREQNRASQRAYRDRQRGKIAELQSKVVALRAQNEKLQARNDMLEAAFQRERGSITSVPQQQQQQPNGRSS